MAWRQRGSSNRTTVLSRSPLPNMCFVTASKSLHLSGSHVFSWSRLPSYFSSDLTVLSQRRDNLGPNVLQVKHPKPHCTRRRFFVATDNLSAVTMASSPFFKLFAHITKPQLSTKPLRQPSLKEIKKSCLFPETPHKHKTPLSLV